MISFGSTVDPPRRNVGRAHSHGNAGEHYCDRTRRPCRTGPESVRYPRSLS